jgi:hypothetical protein
MLHAMKAKNPRMHFEYDPKLKVMLHEYWTFGQCMKAFKHCPNVLSIDDTLLMGKYEGTMLIIIDIDVDRHLVPLAFVIMEKENNYSWG